MQHSGYLLKVLYFNIATPFCPWQLRKSMPALFLINSSDNCLFLSRSDLLDNSEHRFAN